ncbi:hypothetical protein ACQ4LE_001580 [Meloidogyne hapla]
MSKFYEKNKFTKQFNDVVNDETIEENELTKILNSKRGEYKVYVMRSGSSITDVIYFGATQQNIKKRLHNHKYTSKIFKDCSNVEL